MITMTRIPVKSAMEAKVDGNGSGLDGQGRMEGVTGPAGHAPGEHRLDDADEAEHEGDEQQAGLEVAAQRGGDQGGEHKDEPAQHPEQGPEENGGQQDAHGPAAARQQQAGSHDGHGQSGIAEQKDGPAAAERQEGDEKLEKEIGREESQLKE